MPTTAALSQIDICADYACNGGSVLATVGALAEGTTVRATYDLTGDDQLAFSLPGSDAGAAAVRPRCIVRLTHADGSVEEWRQSSEVRRHGNGERVVLQLTAVAPVLDLVDAGPVSDWTGTVPSFAGGMVQATVAEWWAAIAVPTLARSGVAGFVLGTIDDSTDTYDWTWSNTTILAVLRAVTGKEVRVRRNGSTSLLVDVLTETGSEVAAVAVTTNQTLRTLARTYETAQQANAVIPRTSEGRGLEDMVFRVTASNSGTKTLALADPEGIAQAVGTTDDLAGRYVRRCTTSRHYLISASDPVAQTVTLDASTGWPTDGWTAGASTGELIDLRASAPDLTDPIDRLTRPWRDLSTTHTVPRDGFDWAISTVVGTTVTVALAGRYATAFPSATFRTLRDALGGTASVGAMRNLVVGSASVVTTVSSGYVNTATASTGQIVSAGGVGAWPSTIHIGDYLVSASSSSARTACVISGIDGPRSTLTVTPLFPGDTLWGGADGVQIGDVQILRRTAAQGVIDHLATGSDALTLDAGATGFVAGDVLLVGLPAVGQALTTLVDTAAIALAGQRTALVAAGDTIARRNLAGNGWFAQYAGSTVPDGATLVSGATAKTTSLTRYGGAAMQCLGGTSVVRFAPFRPMLDADTTELAVRIPVQWTPAASSTGTPSAVVTLSDVSGGIWTPIATLVVAAGALPADEWTDLVLLNAPTLAALDYGIELQMVVDLGGTVTVDGLQVTAGGDAPVGLLDWTGTSAVWATGAATLEQASDPTRALSNVRLTLRDLYREDVSVNAARQLTLGAPITLTDADAVVGPVTLRLRTIEIDKRMPDDATVSASRRENALTRSIAGGATGAGVGGTVVVVRPGTASGGGDPTGGTPGSGTPGGTTSGTGGTTIISGPVAWVRDRIIAPAGYYLRLPAFGATAAELAPGVADEGALRWPEDGTVLDKVFPWGTVATGKAGAAGSALIVLGRVGNTGALRAYDGVSPATATALRWPLDVEGYHEGPAVTVAASARVGLKATVFTIDGDGVTRPWVGHFGIATKALAAANYQPPPASSGGPGGSVPAGTYGDPCALCLLPTDIAGTWQLDFDAQRLCALATGAAALPTDRSGNGRDAAADGAGATYLRDALGPARGAFVTPGTAGDGVHCPVPVFGDFTYYAVVRVTTGGGSSGSGYANATFLSADVSGNRLDYAATIRADGIVTAEVAENFASTARTATTSTSLVDGATHVFSWRRNSTSGLCEVFVDGVKEGEATSVTGTLTDPATLYLGFGAAPYPAGISYGRVLASDACHDNIDRSKVEIALMDFYGIAY